MLFKILTFAGDSSVGRAVDCRSIGRVFDSPSPDLLCGRNCLNKSNNNHKPKNMVKVKVKMVW